MNVFKQLKRYTFLQCKTSAANPENVYSLCLLEFQRYAIYDGNSNNNVAESLKRHQMRRSYYTLNRFRQMQTVLLIPVKFEKRYGVGNVVTGTASITQGKQSW